MLPNFFDKFNKDIPWLKNNTIYLTRHGSMAYGTNTKNSDEDFKGVCVPPKPYYLGSMKTFEQAELSEPDTVTYEINKFFTLAADSNPNVIEVLFTDDSDHIHIDSLGERLLENREKFLSKKIKFTFSGYAVSQLKRIKTHRRWLLNPPQTPPTRLEMGLPEKTLIPQDQLMAAEAEIRKELDRYQFDFIEHASEGEKVQLKALISTMMAELKITSDAEWVSAARRVGLDDNFILLMQKEREYTSKKREWDQYKNWERTRNKDRASLEAKYGYDTKHGYHLVRLIRMCREILTTGKVIVKRPDFEELLAIRNGAWDCDYLIEWAEQQDKELDELYKTCDVLPKMPDRDYIDGLCIELVEKSLSKYSWYNVQKLLRNLVK